MDSRSDSERIQQLEEQVARLYAIIERQRVDAANQQAEIAALKASATAERPTSASRAASRHRTHRAERVGSGGTRQSSSRRALLKWGGAAAAAAAVTLAASEQVARANPADDGGNLILGQDNTASATTTLHGVTSGAGVQLKVDTSTVSDTTAIMALAGSPGTGVYGLASGSGPFEGAGVSGQLTAGVGYGVSGYADPASAGGGIHGTAWDYVGVRGDSDSSYGVVAFSSTGIDLAAAGNGRFWMIPQTQEGAPTDGKHARGEMIRDSNGDLYICISGDGSDVGTWQKVAAIPAGTSGGALVFLAKPFRLFDTRPGVSGCPIDPGTPMTNAQIRTLQVTGTASTTDATLVVPTGATGIIGGLLGINTSGNGVTTPGSGFLTLQPHNGTPTSSSYLHYYPNQIFHNGVTIGLDADGKLDVGNYGATTNVGLDIFGYII